MKNINKTYKDFLNQYNIYDSDRLIHVLKNYPYNLEILEFYEFFSFNLPKNIYITKDLEDMMNILLNIVVCKFNVNIFYFFGYELVINNTYELKTIYDKDYKIRILNDTFKYYIFYHSKTWVVFSKNEYNILNQKKPFENYTTYELFNLNLFYHSKFDLNKLNKNYNYVFEITSTYTNLLLNNKVNKNDNELILNRIVEKKTYKNIEIEYNNLIYLSKNINYNKEINKDVIKNKNFENLFKLIDLKNIYGFELYNHKTEQKYIYYNTYLTFHKEEIEYFINNPIKYIIEIKNRILNDKDPVFKNTVNLILKDIYYKILKYVDEMVIYFHNIYKNIYIYKNNDIIITNDEKHLLKKIHNYYIENNYIPIENKNIISVLNNLQSEKLISLFNIDSLNIQYTTYINNSDNSE